MMMMMTMMMMMMCRPSAEEAESRRTPAVPSASLPFVEGPSRWPL